MKEGKIIFDICSPGGYIQVLSELLALIKQAKEAGIIVETRSMSVAASCGAMLLVAGTEGHRYGSSYLQVLVHHSTQWSVTSTDEQIERDVNRRKFQNTWLRKHLEDSTNIPKKELDAMLSDDGYYVYGDNLLKLLKHLTKEGAIYG